MTIGHMTAHMGDPALGAAVQVACHMLQHDLPCT